MTPKDIRLGPIYVSIADTYKDLGELEKVVEYYEKEIECHPDDEKETARSYLAIADAEADLGRDLKVVNDHYTFAYTRAVLAEKYPLAKHVLRCRLEYYRNKAPDQVSEIDRDYKDFCSTYDLDPDSYEDVDKESGESESRESQASCDIDCSDLSSDESDEDAASDDVGGPSAGRSLRTRRVAVAAVSKKDERGETPLHRAAREGNLKKIKTLVKGGADVNAYDNAGWTPLHEAALAGKIEIVDYLLRRGGDLTKTGVEVFKSVTEGMTPLHDAALGGHIDVMELMVKRGANMLAKTEKGDTPLDCLRNWRISRERTGELDSQVLTETLEYERKLLEDMKKAGYKGSSRRSVDQVSSVVAEGEDFEVKTVPDDVIEYDSDNECNCGCADGGPCIRLRTPQFASGKASEEYAEAMRGVGTSAKRSSSPRNEGRYLLSPIRQERKRTTSSSSSETVCERDIRPVKRVCADREVEKRGSTLEPMPDVIPVGRFNASSDVGFCRKKAVQPRINEVLGKVTATNFKNFGRRSSNEDLGSMRREYNLQFERSLTEPRFQPQDSTKTKFGRLNVLSPVKPATLTQSPAPSAVLTVIVQVEGKKLLIPVMDANANVGWLAEEASKRFSSTDPARRKPVLTLEKEGGISLSGDDYITVLVQNGENLYATVQSWPSVSPAQKYVDFVKSQNAFPLTKISKSLQLLEESHVFRLPGSSMKASALFPVMKAIENHCTMVEIDLSGHQLGDDNLQILVSSLPNMPNLRRLDLHSSGITVVGIKHLVDLLQAGSRAAGASGPVLGNLAELDISSNPFGDIIGDLVTILLQHLDGLNCLRIENCHLTPKFFDKRVVLENLIQGSQISRWFIGYNKWGRIGLEKWSKLLKGKQLHALGFGGMGSDTATSDSLEENMLCNTLLGMFGGMALVPLEELDLSDCGIQSVNTVMSINRLIVRAKHLRKLHLDKNTNLTFVEVSALLKGLCQRKLLLEELTLTGSDDIFPPSVFTQAPDAKTPISSIEEEQFRTFMELLEKFYLTETLTRFEFTLNNKVPEQWAGFIKGMWITAKGNVGRVTQGERNRVIMVCAK